MLRYVAVLFISSAVSAAPPRDLVECAKKVAVTAGQSVEILGRARFTPERQRDGWQDYRLRSLSVSYGAIGGVPSGIWLADFNEHGQPIDRRTSRQQPASSDERHILRVSVGPSSACAEST
jgi:hypothetical protein